MVNTSIFVKRSASDNLEDNVGVEASGLVADHSESKIPESEARDEDE